jgi:hypothetical protein
MPDLTLRSTWADRPPTNTVDDFQVRDGEKVVGRIYRSSGLQQGWFWGVLGAEIGMPRGHAASLQEAKIAFRAAYIVWLQAVQGSGTRGVMVKDSG